MSVSLEAQKRPSKREQNVDCGAQRGQEGFIYFFLSPECDAVKIGFTNNPEGRLASAKTWLCEDADWEDIFPGLPSDEIAIHEKLAPFRIKREWFQLTDEVWDFLEDLRDRRLELSYARSGSFNRNDILISDLLHQPPKEERDG